jgi:outer membrane protein insertion porin family
LGIALLSAARLALPLALLAAALAPPAAAAQGAPIVSRVEIRSDVPIDEGELAGLIAIAPGEPLDDERVRKTLVRLRLAGLASEVEVLARHEPAGTVAVVVLWADVRVDAVEITGETGLDRDDLAPLPPQRAGQPLREDRVLRGVYRLEEALEAQGYLDARVALEVEVEPATRRARVRYPVAAGERWRVRAITVEGLEDRVPLEAAIGALRSRVDEPYRAAAARDDPERLQRELVRRGYRSARVFALPEVRDAAARRVDLAYEVAIGPRFELEIVGAERKALEKRGLLPFLGEAGYDDALVLQAVALIRSDYQQRGHYRVTVTTEEEREIERLLLRLKVVPGPRLVLEEVTFEGNESFPAERLARLMATSPRRLLLPGSGRLVDEELTADLANLRSFYALEGFAEAKVGPPRIEERGEALYLTVPVVEGPRQRVGTLSFTGVESLGVEELERDLPLEVGGPFHRVRLEQTVDAVSAAYERQGYRSALVSASVDWNADHSLAAVTLDVLEGNRTLVDAVILRGNRRTGSDIVRRFVELEPGDPVSTESLLEVQRSLYRLGLFSQVDVAVPASGGGGEPGEVVIEVEEGKTRSVAYGAGYDSEDGARGLLRLTEANLFGRAISVGLDAIVSQRQELYRLLVQQPYLFRLPIVTTGAVYRETEERTGFDTVRRGVQLGLGRDLEILDARVVYDYRIVETDVLDPAVDLPREATDARVASFTPSLFVDRRDDALDATAGWSLALQVERALPLFDADAEFLKLFGQATGYLPLGRLGVAAVSVRGGLLDNLRAATPEGAGGLDLVPVSERFFAGGRTSHRAFDRDELGIPGETLLVRESGSVVPLGGGALAIANVEWRFPIAGPLGGTAFVDGGNVWREWDAIDTGDVRWGAGVGVRYLSPIGPIRLEIGWKLDREPFESAYVWFVSFGNPF